MDNKIQFLKQDRQVIIDYVTKTKKVNSSEYEYWSLNRDTISIEDTDNNMLLVTYGENVEYVVPEDFAILNNRVYFGFKVHDLAPMGSNTPTENPVHGVKYSHPTGYNAKKFALTIDNSINYFNRGGLTFVKFDDSFGVYKKLEAQIFRKLKQVKTNNESPEEYYDIKW